MGLFWVRGGFPYGYIIFVFFIMCNIMIFRAAKRDVERDEREAKDQRYFQRQPRKPTPARVATESPIN